MIIRNDLNQWWFNHFPLPRPLPIYRTASQWNCQTQVWLLICSNAGATPTLMQCLCKNRIYQFLSSGSNGFLLPANQIETVGRELWAATSVVGHPYSIHTQMMFYPFQYLIDTQLKFSIKSFQLAKEAARHNMGPDPALAADPASYHEL